eukprot:CAMPEP_0179019398 /NCGR_PEP_ID=MMETSP0796-20121207/4846_1 /TAXON_ID=73915 /ORGANISM="Pyrodinium bahamense, Strain pbaha01" /LENGTH=191 /DNA_ID=CAMNT_0020715181 /DNA_START=12 /DNA_END=584 /DNA_ORIENTATION=-
MQSGQGVAAPHDPGNSSSSRAKAEPVAGPDACTSAAAPAPSGVGTSGSAHCLLASECGALLQQLSGVAQRDAVQCAREAELLLANTRGELDGLPLLSAPRSAGVAIRDLEEVESIRRRIAEARLEREARTSRLRECERRVECSGRELVALRADHSAQLTTGASLQAEAAAEGARLAGARATLSGAREALGV